MTSKLDNAIREKLSLEYQLYLSQVAREEQDRATPILNAICESFDERIAALEEKLSDHPAAFLLEESSRTIVNDFVDDVKVCDEIEALSIEILSHANALREEISNGKGWISGRIGVLVYDFDKLSILVREAIRRTNKEEREKSNGESQS